MSKKKEIWDQITNNLKSNLKKSDFETWFAKTSLKKLEPHQAVIGVPNKFVAHWLQDRYLPDIENAFRSILKTSPDIHFISHLKHSHTYTLNNTGQSESAFQHNVNPLKTFERFVAGNCSRFAFSSAMEIAQRPANQYNPLYIYSRYGFGKTHLLYAIGNTAMNHFPNLKIKYIHSDDFTIEITKSLKYNNIKNIISNYCKLDIFLFDDVHRLDTRKRIQEEFLCIFDALYEAKKQIVLTGNGPPNKLKNIHSSLISRLGWGLLTEIQPPDHETKVHIIKQKAAEDQINIPEDVVFYLASVNNNINTLLKNITRIETYSSLNHMDISISMVKTLLRRIPKKEIDIDDIKILTANYFNISVEDLISHQKTRTFSYPRQLAMYFAKKYTHLSYKDIGDAFGSRDHSTVIYAVRRIEEIKPRKKGIQVDLKNMENLLK